MSCVDTRLEPPTSDCDSPTHQSSDQFVCSHPRSEVMSKGCYTCRRRRIICDNGLPTCRKCRDAGKECLGYQKPLVWVKGGVASRGKMMGRSFNEVMRPSDLRRGDSSPSSSSNASPPSAADSPTQSIDISLYVPPNVSGIQGIPEPIQSEDNDDQDTHVVLQRATSVSAPWGLVDPLFKDLSQLSRFYIVHCMFAGLSTCVIPV